MWFYPLLLNSFDVPCYSPQKIQTTIAFDVSRSEQF